jgi:hypothetical protein
MTPPPTAWPPLPPGERLLWQGRPARTFALSLEDAVTALGGLLLIAFSLVMAIGLNPGPGLLPDHLLSPPVLTLPGIAGGLWLFPLRLIYAARRRRSSHYALTTEAAYIRRDGPFGPKVTRFTLSPSDSLTLDPGRPGSVWLRERIIPTLYSRFTLRQGFEYIPEAETVYRLARSVQMGKGEGIDG